MDECTATDVVQIGNQIEQTARCYRKGEHDQHADVVLDSDDNAITHRWRSS